MRYVITFLMVLVVVDVAYAGSSRVPVGRFRTELTSMKELPYHRVVKQRQDFTCGAAALASVLTHQYKIPVREDQVIGTLIGALGVPLSRVKESGFSLLDLKQFIEHVQLRAVGYSKQSIDDLMRFNVPPIVPLVVNGYMHFVVVRDVLYDDAGTTRVLVADPAFGNRVYDADVFNAIWRHGITFYVLPKNAGKAEKNYMAVTAADVRWLSSRQAPTRQSMTRHLHLTRHRPGDYINRAIQR